MKAKYELTIINEFTGKNITMKCISVKLLPPNSIRYHYDGRLNDEELYEVELLATDVTQEGQYYFTKDRVVSIKKI